MIYQLAYCSLSSGEVTPARLDDILDVSNRNNLREDVTGVLMCHDGMFFQILEGERGTVRRRFDKIKQDPRHMAVTIMFEYETEDRSFSDWTMGFAGPDEIGADADKAMVSLGDPRKPGGAIAANDPAAWHLARSLYNDFAGRTRDIMAALPA